MMKKTSKKSCDKKQSYDTMKIAINAIRCYHRSRNMLRDTIHAYKCNICNKYHIGHKYRLNDTLSNLFDQIQNESEFI